MYGWLNIQLIKALGGWPVRLNPKGFFYFHTYG